MFPVKRPTRKLRDLKIAEISAVDRGAGRGVKVLLMKRLQEDEMPTIPEAAFVERAKNLYSYGTLDQHVRELAKAEGISVSKAFDRIMATDPSAAEILAAAKLVNGSDALLLDKAHGSSSNDPQNPHGQSQNAATAGETLDRLRREHSAKAMSRLTALVDAHVASGLSRSEAFDRVQRENPIAWAAAKDARGV
jgi:hypothetical protein